MKKIPLAIGTAVIAVALAACNSGHSGTPATSALATNSAARAVSQDFQRCFPRSQAAQLSEVHLLMKDTRVHPNGSWNTLLGCMGITSKDKPAFETRALASAEKAGPLLLTRGGLKAYFEVTLPGIAAQLAAAAPTPAATR